MKPCYRHHYYNVIQNIKYNEVYKNQTDNNEIHWFIKFVLYSMSEFVGTGKNIMEEKWSTIFF